MNLKRSRVVLALAFVFVLWNVRPLLAANPSMYCDTPQLLHALQQKEPGPEWSIPGGKSVGIRFALNENDVKAQYNGCVQAARDAVGATGSRLAFFGAGGVGVALILGWRPRRQPVPGTYNPAQAPESTRQATLLQAAAVEDIRMHDPVPPGTRDEDPALGGVLMATDKPKRLLLGLFDRPLYRDWIVWLALVATIAVLGSTISRYYVPASPSASGHWEISGQEIWFALDCAITFCIQIVFFGFLPAWLRRRSRRSKAPVAVAMPDPGAIRS